MAFTRQIMSILLFAALLIALPSLRGGAAAADGQSEQPPNAFTWYDKAGQMVDGEARDQLGRWEKLSHKEKRSLLAKLSPVLATVREGMHYPCCMPRINSFDEKMPWLPNGRNLARLFALESDVLATDSHYAQATTSGLDAIYLGRDYSSRSMLIGHLVGIAMQAIGRKSLWTALLRLDAPAARQAAKRLEDISSHPASYAEVLQEEKHVGMAVLQEFLDHPESFRQLLLEEDGNKLNVSNDLVRALYRPLIEDALQDYPKHVDAAIATIQTPYPHWETLPESKNLLTKIFMPDYRKAGFRSLENDALNRLLYVGYALHAYQLEHGQYPETLSSLCPDYLTAIPSDPFADAQPLKYRRTKTGYLLYSIGPDARDDGGKAVEDTKDKEKRFHIMFDSRGDIVAGVNID